MFGFFPDGRRLLALAIFLTTLIGAWMFRYETTDPGYHRNRFTGVECYNWQECWLASSTRPNMIREREPVSDLGAP